MDLWQTEVRASRHATWVVNGYMLSVLAILCLSPWFGSFLFLKPLAMLGLWYEWRRKLRQLAGRVGTLRIDDQEAWYWQQQQWRLCAPLCWLPFGVMISWRTATRTQRFWLMADSMSEQAWRNLRFYWLKGRHRQWK